MFEGIPQRAPLNPLSVHVKVMLIIWCVLLLPWPLFLMGAGMAFEGGDTADAYAFFWSVLTYPILVAAAFLYRRRQPNFVFLPVFSLFGLVLSTLLHGPHSHGAQ
jgi:hypothetical protein